MGPVDGIGGFLSYGERVQKSREPSPLFDIRDLYCPQIHMDILNLSRRAEVDLAIRLAGLGYVAVVLCTNFQCPLFAWLFIAVTGYRLVKGWIGRREDLPSRHVEQAD